MDSFDSAYGPSVVTTVPSWARLTVLAWLPSTSPRAATSSPEAVSSSFSVVMKEIISATQSLDWTCIISSALPNIMIMYFTATHSRRRVRQPRCWATMGAMTPEDLAHLRRARDLMDREYARPLDVPAMARAALMSPAHFSRQFRAAYGETHYGYLMTRRIERAKALLRRGDLSVTDVCMAAGCTSLGSFSARFTELVGESPSAYRARDHGAVAVLPACIAKARTRPSRIREASPA